MKYFSEVELARAFTDGMVFEARGDAEFDLDNYKEATNDRTEIIKDFVKQVEAKAEEKMLMTGKLEGAHYAAMKELSADL